MRSLHLEQACQPSTNPLVFYCNPMSKSSDKNQLNIRLDPEINVLLEAEMQRVLARKEKIRQDAGPEEYDLLHGKPTAPTRVETAKRILSHALIKLNPPLPETINVTANDNPNQ